MITVGIGASLIAGFLGRLMFDRSGGFILAVTCALGIVYLIRRSRERRMYGPASRRY
jgi:hypothetical protein